MHLVFARILQKEGEGAMAAHGVTEKGGIRSVQLGEVRAQKRGELLCDIVVHAPVFPLLLSGI